MRKTPMQYVTRALPIAAATVALAVGLVLYQNNAGNVPDLSTSAALSDGTYTSAQAGLMGDVTVTLTVSGGKASWSVDASTETPSLGGAAADELIAALNAGKTPASLDAVSGATVTSDAVKAAAQACLNAASGQVACNDGTYTATGAGLMGDITVTLTVEGGKQNWSIDASGETPTLGGAAAEEMAAALNAGKAPSALDAVSGATVSSNAIIEAAQACLDQATGAAAPAEEPAVELPALDTAGLSDGTYTAAEAGLMGDVVVTLTMDGGNAAWEIDASTETPGIGGAAADTFVAAMNDGADPAQMDAISGATFTSNAIKGAAQNCIDQAAGLVVAEEPAAEEEAPAEAAPEAAATETAPAEAAAPALTAAAPASNDGTYTAEAQGLLSSVKVTLTVSDDKKTWSVDASGETPALGGEAAKTMEGSLNGGAAPSGLDAISGSTYTSNAVKAAAEACLSKAGL